MQVYEYDTEKMQSSQQAEEFADTKKIRAGKHENQVYQQ